MKPKIVFASLTILAIIVNIAGIINEDFWMRRGGELLFFLPLTFYYLKRAPLKNLNFLLFVSLAVAATIVTCFKNLWYFEQVKLGLWLVSYIFLAREAIKHTEYEKGSRFTSLYFLAIIAIYVYLLSIHVLEIEPSVNNSFTFSLYIIYYLNILFLAIAALVYYLNSFSKKSVFFICLTLSFIFSDVLRDMEVFYFRDMSVEVVGTLIKFAALKLVFLFYVTREKKLRLLHLV
ncbi:hypothetical protein [Salinimicrobium oceani]|uniref:YhhN-like protein n=1 Tax=Salinimicrobium oceani TaxID=2722702 RepID=A0ABX1CWE3_9FLAO|nr:hypothetical protein [Salinimicrobium oceani]NJW51467.1 hypothetical protein [Salinimicrobium oceani]